MIGVFNRIGLANYTQERNLVDPEIVFALQQNLHTAIFCMKTITLAFVIGRALLLRLVVGLLQINHNMKRE